MTGCLGCVGVYCGYESFIDSNKKCLFSIFSLRKIYFLIYLGRFIGHFVGQKVCLTDGITGLTKPNPSCI